MRATRSFSAVIGFLFLVLAVFVSPVASKYGGACIKMPADDGKSTQFHMRIPDGQHFNNPREKSPGKAFYSQIRGCNIRNFTCSYDIDGNAHVDFILKKRNFWGLKNKCDVAGKIARVTIQTYRPDCVDGDPSTLAELWRQSWKP